ncbi:hypothetical protein ACFVT2_16325 [Streptomyces sp. NPDC058000]|uniref:hypothetical protein n=1 Tax=Streptomyces sp. NPDC058000 TaxID=3346299 RepID=UPI0036E1E4FA
MSTGAWTRWCERLEEAWNRHVRYPELYRQLDAMRADFQVRTAWVDELTDEEVEEMQRGLAACIDAMQDTASEVVERPEGTP